MYLFLLSVICYVVFLYYYLFVMYTVLYSLLLLYCSSPVTSHMIIKFCARQNESQLESNRLFMLLSAGSVL